MAGNKITYIILPPFQFNREVYDFYKFQIIVLFVWRYVGLMNLFSGNLCRFCETLGGAGPAFAKYRMRFFRQIA